MKIYKTEAEMLKDVKDGVLVVNDNVAFEFNLSVRISIDAWNINAGDINALDINAMNINARDIISRDIIARSINARDINARDINAWSINADNIIYYAFCCVYNSIKCFSIKAKREINSKAICLDGEVEIVKKGE